MRNANINAEELTPDIRIRIMSIHLKSLLEHLNDTENKHPDTIKYIVNKLLEQVLALEEDAIEYYNELPEEVKQLLTKEERERFEKQYIRGNGYDILDKTASALEDVNARQKEIADNLRQEVADRLEQE